MVKEFYKNGKVYKIIDNTNGNIYIGSTCKTLSQRLAQHRCSYKRYLEGKGNNIKSFDILKNEDYNIILLEKCENISSKEELLSRERHYIDNLECVNKNIPGRTQKEYYEANKNDILEYYKKYRETNIDDIKEHRKLYYQTNKDEIQQLNKKYREENKEELKQYHKKYYNDNKEQINHTRKNMKVFCEKCKCEIRKDDMKRHEKTQKHIKNCIDI